MLVSKLSWSEVREWVWILGRADLPSVHSSLYQLIHSKCFISIGDKVAATFCEHAISGYWRIQRLLLNMSSIFANSNLDQTLLTERDVEKFTSHRLRSFSIVLVAETVNQMPARVKRVSWFPKSQQACQCWPLPLWIHCTVYGIALHLVWSHYKRHCNCVPLVESS